MRIFGLEISRAKAQAQSLSSVDRGQGFWTTIFETFAGAWQQDVTIDRVAVMSFHAIYACITLIANDIGKMRAKLMEGDADGIWSETNVPAFSPVLRKPNRYQNHIQFRENWIMSKLSKGNTYALKQRDQRGVVTAIYILDPCRVVPLVAEDGSVYYQLDSDDLAQIDRQIIVPASEIIHDRMNCLYHPLVGVSPIYASGLAAMQGLAIQQNSAKLFKNMSRPSGILTAPATISDAAAKRLKEHWDTEYTGDNFGKTAVLGDGLKYERISFTAAEAQLIEQLKMTAEVVCSTFHIPPFKIHVGQTPTYQNGEILNQIYYSDCLQSLIEQFEACMDEGLGLDVPVGGRMLGVELDLDGLLRMDTATQIKSLTDGIKGALFTPNEARRRVNQKPLTGGDTVYMQQQNYSLSALDARDRNDPFAKGAAPISDSTAPSAPDAVDAEDDDQNAEKFYQTYRKAFAEALAA